MQAYAHQDIPFEKVTAFETGVAAALPDLPIQYADFAIWQRHWLQGEALERQFSYWRKQLADLPVLQLHYDHPRPLDETFRGATRFVFLPLDLSAQLRALSRAEGVTLFMLLLAAFQILLSRYTGQELHPKRDPSHHPLFQVMFTMHNAFLQPLELTHVTFHPLVRESSVAKFDLAVLFEETEQGIVGALMYNIDLFDGDTIERMVGHFQTLLAGVVADAACPIAGLPLLTPTEHQQLLYARQTSLHASPWLST